MSSPGARAERPGVIITHPNRDKTGFAQPSINAGVLGLITLLIVPVQMLLIAFAMRGFRQGWNVEIERSAPGHGGYGEPPRQPEPYPA